MSAALPGARGLFSVLQDALSKADKHRVRLNSRVWDVVADLTDIADSLQRRPTRLEELVPVAPTWLGALDACRTGMGGVWFHSTDPTLHPMLCRHPYTTSIQHSLVSDQNPRGEVSISDLKLLVMIAHKDVLSQHFDVAEQTLWMATDNRAALSWSAKNSSTSVAARAFLLWYNALVHQRRFRHVATHNHIAGRANVMADDASRRWDLSDSDLISHFNLTYPQALPWRMLPLSSATNSVLTGALFKRRRRIESPPNVHNPPRAPRTSGPLSVAASVWTPLPCRTTPFPSSKSSPGVSAPAPLLPAVDRSGLAAWKTPSAAWARRMPHWGPWTLG